MGRYATAYRSGAPAIPSGGPGLSTGSAPVVNSVADMMRFKKPPVPANIPAYVARAGRIVLPRVSPWLYVGVAGYAYLTRGLQTQTNLAGFDQICYREVDGVYPGLFKGFYLCTGLGSLGERLAPGEVASQVGVGGWLDWFFDEIVDAQHIGYEIKAGVDPYAPLVTNEFPYWPWPAVHPAQNGRIPSGDPNLEPIPPWKLPGKPVAPNINPDNPNAKPTPEVRPRPDVRPLPDPIGDPVPPLDPMRPPDPRPPTSPGPGPVPGPGPSIEIFPRVRVRPDTGALPRPPRAREKEVKQKQTAYRAFKIAANVVTEGLDIVKCFHSALPKGQRQTVKKVRYKNKQGQWVTRNPTDWRGKPITHPRPQVMAKDLWNNWTKGTHDERAAKLSKALACAFGESLQDFVLGQTSQKAQEGFEKISGTRPVGVGTGPAL